MSSCWRYSRKPRCIDRRVAGSMLLLAVIFFAGCGRGDRTQPGPDGESTEQIQPAWFADVTDQWKLGFIHDPGPIDGEYFLPQINGSGAALLDFDNDGRLDIYLLQGGGPQSASTNALFHQRGDGTFEDVSAGSGLKINGTNTGVAVGDVNNDGWHDVVVTQYQGVKLFLNQSGKSFSEEAAQAHLENPRWGTSASFLDYDRDGWLDLVIVNYVFDEPRPCTLGAGRRDYCRPNIFEGSPSKLFHNRGLNEQGKWSGYEDRTDASGLGAVPGAGMGVVCADFNGDHWPDIFIANDMQANCLWINKQDGSFQNEAVTRGLAYNARGQAVSNMGVAYGDVDGDGLADVFVTLFTNERHGLWKQGPRGIFLEETAAAGITQSKWHGTGWGTVLCDFDHDGALDLALVNGFVDRQDVAETSYWAPYFDRNQVFANSGGGKFRDISTSNPAFCDVPNLGRGLCVGDIDSDGALDLLVTQIAGPARILRNIAPKQGHWLSIRAVDPSLKRDAVGAELRLQAAGRSWTSIIQPGQSFQCSNDCRAHFGLGSVGHVDSIDVIWPDGSAERFGCPKVDCMMELRRGEGVSTSDPP